MGTGYFLVRGDKTTCGGKIIEGADDHTIMGIPQARDMDRVTCGRYPGMFIIVGGVPETDIHGRLMAGSLDNQSSCPCKARFIASMMDDTYETDDGGSEPEQHAQSARKNLTSGNPDKKYSHQIKLQHGENNVSVQDIPYVFILNNNMSLSGKTNQDGETERIYTDTAQKVIALTGKLADSWLKRGKNFGSLKEIDNRKIELTTEENEPVKYVNWINGRDYIVIVAARTAVTNWIGMEDSKGNQYRFINCGLEQLQQFPPASKQDSSSQRIMVVFSLGYTQKDIDRINDYTKAHDGRIIYVKNKDELVSFLNQRKEKGRVIKELVILCHGVIKTASYHYHHEDKDIEKNGMFKHEDIAAVHESVFDYDAHVTTYACRAGISDGDKDFSGKDDAGQKDSPAQKMADNWDVMVKAFEMSSDYSLAYGTGKEIKEAQEYGSVVEKYKKDIDMYNKEKAKGNTEVSPPVKPEGYDEKSKRHADVTTRDKNEKSGGGPIAPNGAWHMPRTGDSPKGLKSGLQDYQPEEWVQ
ncbi:TPA: PAAR domain-containing protein [Escherichia coli]|uniref:PAAR domain-containing protein n=1 Tax=Escherichia coli TaxID=562 RepID=UPI0009CE3A68|nr:PAAR domain-containing protein [Escherichia coli]OOJ96233.1 hypothetical protein BMT78_09650 [Escherichia coli]RBY27669.1 PAAR domain-containing protein [Escherichia coli]RCZ06350.1 PAAR domain-containing protein [Escherichia coli]RCZ22549.1 PAAR domain-containing protein [Escherichia coli]RDA58973.1 PAAR domain-containing protein [Escherichia coli]